MIHSRRFAAVVTFLVLAVGCTRQDDPHAGVETGDDSAVWAAWREATATLGRDVRIETADEPISGRAVDITNEGRLVLLQSDRSRIEIDVGDVVHLRPR